MRVPLVPKAKAIIERYKDREYKDGKLFYFYHFMTYENDRWRFWHDKWAKDPGLKEDMNDYFLMEEWKENKKK